MPKTAAQIMAERKEIVRQEQEAFDRRDYQRARELEIQAAIMLQEAREAKDNLTTEDAYGLMGH